MVNGKPVGQYVEVTKLGWNVVEVSSLWPVFGMLSSCSNSLTVAGWH